MNVRSTLKEGSQAMLHPLVHRLALLAVFILFALAPKLLNADALPQGPYHIETVFTERVHAVLTFHLNAPSLNPCEWIILAPRLNDMPGQQATTSCLSVDNRLVVDPDGYDTSLQRRPICWSRVAVTPDAGKTDVTCQAAYDANLCARRLEPGAAQSPVSTLTEADRGTCLISTYTTDYLSPSFTQWIKCNGLQRLSTEDDLTYAYRAFRFIRAHYSYEYKSGQDRRASSICQTGNADCGGLSNLFVATLRQAEIPARVVSGRWAISSDRNDALHESHVKSEFYVNTVGWVPVEMSGAVYDKSGDALSYFGQDSGEFLTLSVNTDYMFDTVYWGTTRLMALQGICCWGRGAGSLAGSTESETWTVTHAPVLELAASH